MTVQWNDAELLEVYLDEAGENLATIEEGLLALEQQPSDVAMVDEIFRAAHTLKGGAATLSLTTLRDVADTVEELFAAIRGTRVAATPAIVGVLLHAVDLLRALLPEKLGDAPTMSDAQQALCDELRRLSVEDRHSCLSSGGGEETGKSASPPRSSTTLRVSTERLDRLLDVNSEINLARSWFRHNLFVAEDLRPEVIDREQKLQVLERELQELIMAARMVPLEPLFRQSIRTVHDAAQACGKNVQLLIEGGDIEIDTRLAELIKDPLMHIVRNAVDHGIEAPTHRQCKREVGTIRLRARRESPALVIEVSDDGRGFESERILARGIELGLVAPGAPLSDDDIFALVFVPGFSTATLVNDISGRGVGMDVVRKNISALRGSVRIESEPGLGTTISIRLPLTLAVVAALPVDVGDETYALPLDSVVECADLPPGSGDAVDIRGERVPTLSLATAFEVPSRRPARQVVVVVRHAGGKAAFIVDAISASIQAVIKPLGKLFAAFPFIAGSTVLSNGRVAFILDAGGVVDEMRRRQMVAMTCCEK
jgi:two-component system, chemotaxis family, sensor kinase CheA